MCRPPTLERVVIIDDNLGSCMLHPDNVVPIRPFLGDEDDRELGTLLPLLRTLRGRDDVRDHLRNTFRVRETMLQGLRALRGHEQ